MMNWARTIRGVQPREERLVRKNFRNFSSEIIPTNKTTPIQKLLISLILVSVFTVFQAVAQKLDYKIDYAYDNSIFSNPERGIMDRSTFRYKGETDWSVADVIPESVFTECRTKGYTIIWHYFGLQGYHDKKVPDDFVKILETNLNNCRKNGLKLMIRFMYSSDYNTTPREADLDWVLVHMDQFKDVINNNKDVVFALQFGWVGAFGETANTTYYGSTSCTVQSDPESMAKRASIINNMVSKFDKDIMIQLRYPKDWIPLNSPYWTLKDTLTQSEAYSGSKKARIGFFNDSYLWDYRDRGTYSPDKYLPEYKEIVRAASKYTPYVGETSGVEKGYDYYQPDSAYHLSNKRGLTALYDLYHPTVINYWKDKGVWDSLQIRMGYRYYLESVAFTSKEVELGQNLDIEFDVRNVGFNQAFNPKDCELVFKNSEKTIIVDLEEDVRKWWKNTTTTVKRSIPLDSRFSEGSYDVYLRISDSHTRIKDDPRYSIRLANKGTWNASSGSNDLGATINILSATTPPPPPPPPPASDPVILKSHPTSVESGAEVTIDASESYDPDGKDVTIAWTYPASLEIIQESEQLVFLAPKVDQTSDIILGLEVSNGEKITSESITISVEPVSFGTPAMPELYVDYNSTVFGGRLETLDASSSLASIIGKGDLTINWIAPDGVELSSNSEPTITYLAPDTRNSTSIRFFLVVTFNGTTEYKSFDVTVLRYKQYAKKINVKKSNASSFKSTNYPENVYDGDLVTFWSADGIEEWVELELEAESQPEFVKIAFENSTQRKAIFDLYASDNGMDWVKVENNLMSCGYSNDAHIFDIDASTLDGNCRYMKVVGRGNTINENNSFAEVEVYGTYEGITSIDDASNIDMDISVYPNPAEDYVNLDVNVDAQGKIFSLDGKLLQEFNLNAGSNRIDLNNLMKGMYILKIDTATETIHSQQLVILR